MALVTYTPSAYPTIPGGEKTYFTNEFNKIANAVKTLVANLSGPAGPVTLLAANNLSDLTNIPDAITNLGLAAVATTGAYADLSGLPTLGTAAAHNVADFLQPANNLSDVANLTTVVSNLGLTIGTDVLAYDAQLTSNVRQVSISANQTTVLSDMEKHWYHPSADTTARTWTIDSNANMAAPLGAAITFVNDLSAGVITIAITSDTLVWSPSGGTGSRTLAAGGMATAIKVGTTRWFIAGSGLT